MIGYEDSDDDSASAMLRTRTRLPALGLPITGRIWAAALAAPALLIVAISAVRPSIGLVASSSASAAAETASVWHGVSLGGWLVMEINPSSLPKDAPLDLRPQWMYDQLEANSELDFVTALREQHGDEYAIATMRNHWAHYYTDEMIDAAQKLGVNAMRIPVGYWIVDAPVGGASAEEYGISPEGFVTGGLNVLREMLIRLKARGIEVLLDVHAAPCNSACVSDGLYCAAPLAFAPAASAATVGDIPRCGGGAYPTSRRAEPGAMTWSDVAVNAVGALAQWVAALPEEARCVRAFQLANEPALGADAGLGTPPREKEDAVFGFYERALPAARVHLPTITLMLSFIPATDRVMAFLQMLDQTDAATDAAANAATDAAANAATDAATAVAVGAAADPTTGARDRKGGDSSDGDARHDGGGAAAAARGTSHLVQASSTSRLVADHHYYLNFQTPYNMTWEEIHRRACSAMDSDHGIGWSAYVAAARRLIIGEWSLAVDHDAKLDLDDEGTRSHLARLYREQLEVFYTTPGLVGAFFWTLRMGSGWDPRPTEESPRGRQLPGSSAWHSLADYPYPVWSLLEMARLGVAAPLDVSYAGTCRGEAGA